MKGDKPMQELFNLFYLYEYMMNNAPDEHVYKEYKSLKKSITKLIAFMGER